MALTGSSIASTYIKLLRINSDTMGADATASYIQDSADTDSALSISTTRVGIGTASPSQLLTVSSSSADAVMAIDCSYAGGDGLLIIESASGRDSMIRLTEADTLKWQIYNDGSDSDKLKIQDDGDVRVTFDQSGNVGIGTDTPASGMILDVYGAMQLRGAATSGVDAGSNLNLWNDTNGNSFISTYDLTINTGSNSARTASMIIDTNGNVGINEDSPAHKLDVDGGIVEQGGVLKENLLTNSGFDVWSNSTLLEATSGAAPVLDGANAALVNNLLTNGGFDSAATSWTAGNSATLSDEGSGKTGNCLRVTENGDANPYAHQSVTTVVGKLYQFTCYVNAGTEASYRISIGTGGAASTQNFLETGEAADDWTSTVPTIVFEATGTTTTVSLHAAGMSSGETMEFDSVTLYEVTPGCVAANTLAMDGWVKDANLDIYRQHYDATLTKDGSFYSLKVIKGGDGGEEIIWADNRDTNQEFLQRFAGRTITFGCWAYDTNSDNTQLKIHDGVGSVTGDFHTGSSSWEWLEITHTVNASPTQMRAYFRFGGDTSDVAYISQPMLVFGSSIGEGNYTRPQGEIVYTEKAINTSLAGGSVSSNYVINLEADTSGMVPKGAIAINAILQASCATLEKYLRFYPTSSGLTQGANLISNVANNVIANDAWTPCDSNGDIYIWRNDTFNEVYFQINAIQLQ